MDRWTGKVAIVTGASSGIGECIAAVLVENGLKVVGLARRVEKMRDIAKRLAHAKGSFHAIACDVTKEEEIVDAFKHAADLGDVDVLVNNAGLAFPETIIGGTTESFKTILDVNVLAAAICTREAVKLMKERNAEGHIINISSIAGQDVGNAKAPLSLYQTSKHALTAMSKVIKNEITADKMPIRVTNLSPGLVKTEMPIIKAYGGEELFKAIPYLNPQDIADAVIYVLGAPKHVQITELTIVPLNS